MKKVIFLIFLILVNLSANEVVKLTTLEWAPYIGKNLKFNGFSAKIVKDAFKQEGYKVEFYFFPWKRALKLGYSKKYDGCFPAYFAKDREKNYIYSNKIISSPIGFVENINKPIKWQKLNDLKKYTIGTVKGYVNTKEFDEMANKKELNIQSVVKDSINLKKVGKKRIDMAIIDKYTMDYILSKELKNLKKTLNFNKNILENKPLFILFKKGERGKELNKIFSSGLKKIDIKNIHK